MSLNDSHPISATKQPSEEWKNNIIRVAVGFGLEFDKLETFHGNEVEI